jgi:hypothetical protein
MCTTTSNAPQRYTEVLILSTYKWDLIWTWAIWICNKEKWNRIDPNSLIGALIRWGKFEPRDTHGRTLCEARGRDRSKAATTQGVPVVVHNHRSLETVTKQVLPQNLQNRHHPVTWSLTSRVQNYLCSKSSSLWFFVTAVIKNGQYDSPMRFWCFFFFS